MKSALFPNADSARLARHLSSEAFRLVEATRWDQSPLGPLQDWPESLKAAVRTILVAPNPMALLVGQDGILIYNDEYADFAGQRHPEIFGLPATEAWPEIADFNRHKIALGLAGDSLVLRDQEISLDRNGELQPLWLDLNYSPVIGDDGMPIAVMVIVLETTDRVLAQRSLARAQERLSMALDGSGLIGTWDWDIVANKVVADAPFARIFSIDPDAAKLGVPIEQFLAAIHPDDVERVSEEIAYAMENSLDFRSEYRLVQRDGSVRWIIASGKIHVDETGKASRFPGVIVDTTEQRTTDAALIASEAQFRALANSMPQMVWSTRPDGFHDYYNARWYQFTGTEPGTTDGEGWAGLFHMEDQPRAWELWRHSLTTGEPYQVEYRLRHHTGQYRWTLGLALPVRDADGTIVRWVGTCTDIHESKLAAEERELIAQELSHRIKNIFAVLTSIISLSSRGQPIVKPFADQLRQRIFALGEAHDFVRPHSTVSGPPENQGSLKALVQRLTRPYAAEYGDRIEFSGDDAEIDDGAATPLALLIHELATNSAKYGALLAEGGKIILEGVRSGDQYQLSWKELGGPNVPEITRNEGFGSRLITLSVEGQLRGKIKRLWEKDGLRVEAEIPVSALRRSGKLGSR